MSQRRTTIERAENAANKTREAFAHMEEPAAVALLLRLDDQEAAGILSRLEKWDIARILEAAPADKASAWVKLLLTPPQLPDVPVPFRDQAKRAGLYDDTQELLQQWQSQQTGGSAPTAPAPDGGAPGTAPGQNESTSPGAAAPQGNPAAQSPSAAPAGRILPASNQTKSTKPLGGTRARGRAPRQRAGPPKAHPRTGIA